jgi:NAD+ synthase
MLAVSRKISRWLKTYAECSGRQALVVGVSGGVDSGLVSTLCAKTELPTVVVTLPCNSNLIGTENALAHIAWLEQNFPNVVHENMDLSAVFAAFKNALPSGMDTDLGFANAKSRLRMTALYHVATSYSGLVVGTGNKVEDFGVGFFTKYGDGGVDVSPIGDLTKTQVRRMANLLGVPDQVANAVPTDGLWEDGRTDEDQLGATYAELEWAMDYIETNPHWERLDILSPRKAEVLRIYNRWHLATAHKMRPTPTFKLDSVETE